MHLIYLSIHPEIKGDVRSSFYLMYSLSKLWGCRRKCPLVSAHFFVLSLSDQYVTVTKKTWNSNNRFQDKSLISVGQTIYTFVLTFLTAFMLMMYAEGSKW